ncbi:flagellar filament capping protein FliD [Ramlibacter tataouinensis]|uniref:flagellar filament capping protein FliD n=1 Tax=Ramlibacter tataouinensis TaxID=94132 RepID=UPI0022F3F3CD|nr:flagellar filament capping protein FliD [Ramlibacter tataouinensis]WBY00622.1 flagellar filament capping protein FliD [Ramlibacter tataouinensis]
MASISSLGVGANLDLNGLLEQLAAAERAPVVALQRQQISYTAKLTAYSRLQGALGTLQAAASKLSDPRLFEGVKAGSSAADVLTAAGSAHAVPGVYSASVSQLAQAQSLVSGGRPSSTTAAVGAGTVSISWGTIAGGAFDAASGRYTGAGFAEDAEREAVSIAIAAGTTLEGIRDAINAKADAGITASIVNDGSASPHRLVLTSTRTGENASLRISVSGDDALQDLLAHDPAGIQNLRQTAAAQDAKLTVNGIAVTSQSNTVAEAIQGVTLNLLKTGASQVNLQRDTGSVGSAIAEFVNAYNGLQATARQLTAYNAETRSAAPLVGDGTLRLIQTSLRSALNTPQAGSLQTLSRIGIAFQKDGTLQIDSAKLTEALGSNLAGVAELFSTRNPGGGYGQQLAHLVEGFSKTDGTLDVATAGVKTSLKRLDERIVDAEERVAATVARYRGQFTQLDLMMSRMASTSAYLTQQFANLNLGGSGKK